MSRPSSSEIALSNDAERLLVELAVRLDRLQDGREHPAVRPVYDLLDGARAQLHAAYQASTGYGAATPPPPYVLDDLEEAIDRARRLLTADVKS